MTGRNRAAVVVTEHLYLSQSSPFRGNPRSARSSRQSIAWRILSGLLVLLGCSGGQLSAAEADLILEGGRIVSDFQPLKLVEAMAIQGDRIVAVGSSAEIAAWKGKQTQVIPLQGKMVIPGLIDSHVHPTGAAMYEFDHPIPPMESVADVLQYVAQRAAALPPDSWIVMRQVFITRLKEQRYPTRAELDSVAPQHPVLFATGPDAAVNSRALALSGIDKNFQIPAGQPGIIERDPQSGEPTGLLRNCTRLVKQKSAEKSPTPIQRRERLKELLAAYNAVGITSIVDKDASDGAVELYQQLREARELTCRVYAHASVNGQSPLDQIQTRIATVAKNPHRERNDFLRVNGIKVYLDGGMLTGSAYMRRPWGVSEIYSIKDPEYRGLLFIPQDKLIEIVKLAAQHELQMTAHTVGDSAVETLIAAYAAVDREIPLRERRMCITHCNFMTADSIPQMKALGIVADLQPAWLWLDGKTLLKQFGDERLTWFQPYRSLFDTGVIIGGGSDHMQRIGSLRSINPYNPFLGIWICLQRVPRQMDNPLHPEQRITRAEALQLYTRNNAWTTFDEQSKGTLTAGKLADFAILDRNLLDCPIDEVREIKVLETWLGGRKIYTATDKQPTP